LFGVAMSASGQYQTVVNNSGNIYTCIIPYISLTANGPITASGFKIPGGLSTEYLVADGTIGAKSFIIDHPVDPSKYLVHACLEGPEAGVYYRGKSEIFDGEKTIILPDYVSKLASDFTVLVTPIYNGKLRILNCSEFKNNCFTVYGEGEFYWSVIGKRCNIDVEPYKNAVNVKGDGPYKYIM